MKYTVNVGSPLLTWFAGLCGTMFLASMLVPRQYQWITFALLFAGVLSVVIELIRVAWNNRSLRFTEGALRFTRCTIGASEIKHIRVYDDTSSFTICFAEYKLPIHVSLNRADERDIEIELRQWAWRHFVKIQQGGSRHPIYLPLKRMD